MPGCYTIVPPDWSRRTPAWRGVPGVDREAPASVRPAAQDGDELSPPRSETIDPDVVREVSLYAPLRELEGDLERAMLLAGALEDALEDTSNRGTPADELGAGLAVERIVGVLVRGERCVESSVGAGKALVGSIGQRGGQRESDHRHDFVLPPPSVERRRRRGLYPLARSRDDDRHAACRRGGDRLLGRRIPGMERQVESAPVYREQEPPTEILVRADRLFRRHVDVLPGPIAGADLDEREIERAVRRSCRLEAIEVSAVAAEEHAMARTLHDPGRPERAVASERIAPGVVAGGCGDELEVPDPDGFSPVELGDLRRWDRPGLEVGADAERHGEAGSACGEGGARRHVEVVEVVVGDDDHVDGRQRLDRERRWVEAFRAHQRGR